MFPDIGKEVGQAGYQEVVFRNNVNKEVFRNLLHLQIQSKTKIDEKVNCTWKWRSAIKLMNRLGNLDMALTQVQSRATRCFHCSKLS